MVVFINGEHLEFGENKTLKMVIESLQIEDKVMAAAVNSNVVKKDEWGSFVLKDSDKVELLQFVGGG